MRLIQIKATKIGCRLFRNNVGVGWAGIVFKPTQEVTVRISETDVVIRDARPLHAGLGPGTSDLIGWTPVKITPDMVGLTLAIFTASEVKSPYGRLTTQQKNYIEAVQLAGGIAVCAKSIEDFERAVGAVSGRGTD